METGASFHHVAMSSDLEGSLSLTLAPEDTAAFFIIASMPEAFTNVNQKFTYRMKIDKDVVGIEDALPQEAPEVVGRWNLLGQPVSASFRGIQVVKFSDGSRRKYLVR